MNPYFTVNDSEHFTFYRIPKLLFTDEIYQTVSTDAKMLYGLLLDRLSLSEKNDWKDEHGRVYQYFPSIRRRSCCISDTKRSAACLQNWMQPTLSSAAVRGRARPTAST